MNSTLASYFYNKQAMKPIMFVLLFFEVLNAQIWTPPRNPGVSKEVYNSNIGFIRHIRSYSDVKDNFTAWNLAISYRNLCTPSDTVLKYMNLAIKKFGHEVCNLDFEPENGRQLWLNNYFGSIYHNSFIYLCCVCDSIRNSLNGPLSQYLIELSNEDQKDRMDYEFMNQRKFISKETKLQQGLKIHQNDSIRVIQVDSIIGIYGYPGKSVVGLNNASCAVNIILHSPLIYMERLFPYVKTAVDKNELNKYNLATLEDRILWLNGKKQKYGTQYKIVNKRITRLL